MNDHWPIRISNNSGEVIPAFGLMVMTGSSVGSNGLQVTVGKIEIPATRDGDQIMMFNSGKAVPISGYGWGRLVTSGPFWCATDGLPFFGEMWGPSDDSWDLTLDKPGFMALGAYDGQLGKALVQFQPHIIRYATLSEDLAAGSFGSPTTAGAVIQNNDSGGFEDGPTIEVSNQWEDFELDADKNLKVEWDWHYMEWAPYVGDCQVESD